jgi:hypothetical protein
MLADGMGGRKALQLVDRSFVRSLVHGSCSRSTTRAISSSFSCLRCEMGSIEYGEAARGWMRNAGSPRRASRADQKSLFTLFTTASVLAALGESSGDEDEEGTRGQLRSQEGQDALDDDPKAYSQLRSIIICVLRP